MNNILIFIDTLCLVIAGYASAYWCQNLPHSYLLGQSSIIIEPVLVIVLINTFVMGKMKFYSDRRPVSYFNLGLTIIKALTIEFAFLSAILFLFQINYSREFLIFFAIFSYIFLILIRFIARFVINRFSSNSYNARKLLVVGNLNRGKIVSNVLEKQLSWGHEILGRLSVRGRDEDAEPDSGKDIGCIEDLADVLRTYPIDEVIFALEGDRSIDLLYYITICKKMGVSAKILPAMWEPGKPSLSVEKFQEMPFLTIQVGNNQAIGLLYKRILDLLGGVIGSILLLMMLPLVAIIIKRDSTGPVFFKQQRIGKSGRVFQLYKFRSMYQDAETQKKSLMKQNEMNGQMFKMKNDPRITQVGKWLRKTSLDEFPQFFNVLRGEMSLVGTRPPTPEEVDDYQIWHFKRISIKPGITGLWQISGRNQITEFNEIVELDCMYIDNWRFLEDIRILMKTISVVLRRKGAI